MSGDVIPEDCRQFLLQNIDSIAQWEALLLLRAEPERLWDSLTLSQQLYVGESETVILLKALVQRRLLEAVKTDRGTAYRYQVADGLHAAMLDRLADLYKQYLIPMTKIIHAKGGDGINAFANAFRLRKD